MKSVLMTEDSLSEFASLEKIVIRGDHPNSPNILKRYLNLGDIYIQQAPIEQRIALYVQILDALIEVVCDTFIPEQWRQLCLDNCYYPLAGIASLASTEADRHCLRQQYQKLRTLSHYFC